MNRSNGSESADSLIEVYCDESGTMPVGDDDDAFVAAAVAVSHPLSDWGVKQQRTRNAGVVARRLRDSGAVARAAVVLPVPGYGERLSRKLGQMETMVRAELLLRNRSPSILKPGEFRVPNFVWGEAMCAAVAAAVGSVALERPETPQRVDVYLDEKTMVPAMRNLVGLEVSRLGRVIQAAAREAAELVQVPKARAAMLCLAERLRLDKLSVSISWSDEATFKGSSAGLALADRYAWMVRRDVSRFTPGTAFLAALKDVGVSGTWTDITEQLVRPIATESAERWRIRTGLPVPGF